jgi:carbon-monoxide dehydrogenase iron sulfur subunit
LKRILVNVDRCSGCRLCEMICSFSHENAFGSSISRITVKKEDIFGFDLPIVCCHCDQCSAMGNCPSKALERKADGLIFVNEKKCTGCGKCLKTCIMGAIRLHPRSHIPLICDRCNGKPQCVEKCPTKALAYMKTEMQQPKLATKILEETLKRWRIIA